jgi:hypothetical protein
MNAPWHRAHPLPRGATFDERVAWHREHVEHCGCRKPPPEIAERIAADGPGVARDPG